MAAISFKESRDRHDHPVVAALAESLAFLFSDANHAVHTTVDTDFFADRVGIGHQVAIHELNQ